MEVVKNCSDVWDFVIFLFEPVKGFTGSFWTFLCSEVNVCSSFYTVVSRSSEQVNGFPILVTVVESQFALVCLQIIMDK